jgi:hypothetical protein
MIMYIKHLVILMQSQRAHKKYGKVKYSVIVVIILNK